MSVIEIIFLSNDLFQKNAIIRDITKCKMQVKIIFLNYSKGILEKCCEKEK